MGKGKKNVQDCGEHFPVLALVAARLVTGGQASAVSAEPTAVVGWRAIGLERCFLD
jgi:hypothetical protein